MKNFLIAFLMIISVGGIGCAAGVAAMYYYNIWSFETHTGIPIDEMYDAEIQCERMSMQQCTLQGYFVPDGWLGPTKLPVSTKET